MPSGRRGRTLLRSFSEWVSSQTSLVSFRIRVLIMFTCETPSFATRGESCREVVYMPALRPHCVNRQVTVVHMVKEVDS